MRFFRKLFGFRSNVWWKKIIACLYYFFCLILVFYAVTDIPKIVANMYNLFIHKTSKLFFSLSFFVPCLFLSDFNFRNKVLIIRKKKWWTDILGYIVIFLIMLCASSAVTMFHSTDYLKREEIYFQNKIAYKNNNLNISGENKEDIISGESNNDNVVDNDDLEQSEESNDIEDNPTDESLEDDTSSSDNNYESGNDVNVELDNNTESNVDNNTDNEDNANPPPEPIKRNDIKIHYIDVWQGDSIFIELPNGKTMLIDAGESKKQTNVSSYISKLGYSSIDYVIATHPHADHIGGMAHIITKFNIGSIYMPNITTTSWTYENLIKTISIKGLKIKNAKAGVNILNEGDLNVEMIAPNANYYEKLNDYSAVIKITYGSRKFLFMGDAESVSELEIIKNTDVSADVIKIGHHGSYTSSDPNFINRVNAKYAIISVGVDNDYGHPHDVTLNKWIAKGTTIYRTDINGNIVVTSDGNDLNVDTDK